MKRQVPPVVTAIVLIIVLGAVLGLYTRGLLGTEQGEGGEMGGAPEPPEAPPPPVGLSTVHVTTFAGYTRPGYADGNGWEAEFNGPSGIALAPDGSLYVADSRNHRLRRVTADGTTTTVAGSGPVDCLPGGFADGPAHQARLFNPTGLAVAADGTVYFADSGNHRIRALKDGVVTTVAGGPTEADELGMEEGGYRDGPADSALFRFPSDVALTRSGDILVSDLGNAAVRRIAQDGTVTTVAQFGGLGNPVSLVALDGQVEPLIVADAEAAALFGIGSAGRLSPRRFTGVVAKRPTAVCALPGGRLAVADAEWHTIHGVEPSGRSVLLAGILPPGPHGNHADGTGADARFAAPCALVAAGNVLYVADFGNNCIRALTLPAVWAEPPPPGRSPRERWRRTRQGDQRRTEGDGVAHRGEEPYQDLRGRRAGAEAY